MDFSRFNRKSRGGILVPDSDIAAQSRRGRCDGLMHSMLMGGGAPDTRPVVTWNPLDAHASMSLSNGNLTATPLSSAGTGIAVRATSYITQSCYWEMMANNSWGGAQYAWLCGAISATHTLAAALGKGTYGGGHTKAGYWYIDNSSSGGPDGTSWGDNIRVGIDFDYSTRTIYFYKLALGSMVFQAALSLSNNGPYYPAVSGIGSGSYSFNGYFNSASQVSASPRGYPAIGK
ncbi:hypothetical protein SAMN02949497_1751 [Methylomagnum ishizawai]|uniref:B30.2/SPRY domain-containing protein n=1 Tax=Methylomagnum ishizawai TaxID=1760988 RepID=A0A1Y6CVX6_9GAMM|nr:hypothetical protein SAMN02949497_1751 [Methylomagnum ishizawai]